jgi:two-component system, chemotaxis family, chemotaxis protein CheY
MRMMVVDDSNLIRTRISKVVSMGKLEHISIVGLAKNGVEAVRIAKATQPDVITMDLTMPEMDGLPCIASILQHLPKTHILVISALTDKATAIQALKLGARGFLAKPFSDDELQLALLDMLDT